MCTSNRSHTRSWQGPGNRSLPPRAPTSTAVTNLSDCICLVSPRHRGCLSVPRLYRMEGGWGVPVTVAVKVVTRLSSERAHRSHTGSREVQVTLLYAPPQLYVRYIATRDCCFGVICLPCVGAHAGCPTLVTSPRDIILALSATPLTHARIPCDTAHLPHTHPTCGNDRCQVWHAPLLSSARQADPSQSSHPHPRVQ
jgi:hypothetical protein